MVPPLFGLTPSLSRPSPSSNRLPSPGPLPAQYTSVSTLFAVVWCGAPPPAGAHSNLTTNGSVYLSWALYTCQEGARFPSGAPNHTRHCGADGLWTSGDSGLDSECASKAQFSVADSAWSIVSGFAGRSYVGQMRDNRCKDVRHG